MEAIDFGVADGWPVNRKGNSHVSSCISSYTLPPRLKRAIFVLKNSP